MKSIPTIFRTAVFAAVSCAIQPSSASAQTASGDNGETVVLPRFNVDATAGDAYRPVQSQSINRVAGSILDTPFSVNVATRELLNDLGANAAFDVTRYFPGMSPGRGTGAGGIQDRQNFRGFESFSKTIDNFSSFLLPTGSGFQATFDPAFIERIELVMGPNSVLSPTGSPGGSSNVITKSPQYTYGSDLSVMVGNYNAQKVTIDSTGPLDPAHKWAYRIIGSAQDTDTYVPSKLKQYNGSAMLQYNISNTARLTVKYFVEQWGLYGPVANTNDNGEQIYTAGTIGGTTLSNSVQPGFSRRGSNGDADWSTRIDRVHIGEVVLTAALSPNINMRLGGEILFDGVGQELAFPRTTPAETFDLATGVSTSVAAINPQALPEVGQISRSNNRQIQFQNDYAGNFEVGSVTLQPVVGWSSQAGRVSNNYTLVDNNLPAANLYAGDYNPPVPPQSDFAFSAYLPEVANLFQAYGVIRASFLDNHVFLTGGASRIWANVNDYSFKGMYLNGVGQIGAAAGTANYLQDFTFANTGNALAPSVSDSHDTYLGGVLVKPLRNVSVYGSFSTNAGIAANNPLWQSGKQYEFGVKSEFFNQRLQIAADHFQITQSNVSTQNPLFNTGQSTAAFLLSDQTSHGYEFSVVGGVTSELSVIASATYMKLRDPLGRRVRNVPDSIANLLLNYHFGTGILHNANVFGGVNYVGKVAGETVSSVTALGAPALPGYYLPSWAVLNLGAGYTYQRYRFNLNVDNALDSHFWWQPASRISVSPYPGLTVRFTTTMHF